MQRRSGSHARRPPAARHEPADVVRSRASARAAALVLVSLALLAPAGARGLAFVPAATLLALLRFRPDERHGLVVVDGALLAGGLVAFYVP